MEQFKKTVGIRRLRCLHVNDSQTPLGSNRDRHAIPGDGELGAQGLRRVPVRAALREPAGAVRGPGHGGHAPDKVDVDKMKELRAKGLAARRRTRLGVAVRLTASRPDEKFALYPA